MVATQTGAGNMRFSTTGDRRSASERVSTRSRRAAAATVLAVVLAAASPAVADGYDAQLTGHPLRIVAYVVHPIGVILESLIFRPAHWLVHRSSLKGLFGHTD